MLLFTTLMRKTVLILSSLIALVLLAWFVLSRVSSPEPVEEAGEEEVVLEEEATAAVEEPVSEPENPIEGEIPDVNPAANTNPFGGAYKNPFE